MSTPDDNAKRNLFDALDVASDKEVTTQLLRRPGLRVERIVSTGQSSPPGFWYDQPHDEWVLLLAGSAAIEIAGESERSLSPGDCLLLPANRRHRIAWTDPNKPTVWLAIHFGEAVSA